MPTSFPRTVGALRIDRFGSSLLALLIVVALLCAWLGWFSFAAVTRYEVTATARLEIDQEAHGLQSPVLARVEASHLILGRIVQPGDLLVELDSHAERLQVQEERRHLASLEAQLQAQKAQIETIEQARAREQQSARVAFDEAAAKFREADAQVRENQAEAARLEQLRAEGLVAAREAEQATFELERRRHAAEALRLDAERLEREQRTRESERNAELAALQTQIEKLEGDRRTSVATIQRLEYEVDRRMIRAPVAGQIAEAEPLRPGMVVDEAEKLGAIVPTGILRVVAQFPPAAALGRIRPGQRARVRLDGFPWAQYGSIPAKVSRVAGEVRDGVVRVECSIDPTAAPRVSLQHGLPGSVEVEIERLTPVALVMRAAGSMWAAPRSAGNSAQ